MCPMRSSTGRVLEEGGEVPIVGAGVDIWPAESGASRIRLHDTWDDFGDFALAGLEPGDLVLTVYKPGYEMYRKQMTCTAHRSPA